jgi:oligopeptide/dipeptide ABC transporter ATP-binding protein
MMAMIDERAGPAASGERSRAPICSDNPLKAARDFAKPLLQVEELNVDMAIGRTTARVVSSASFSLDRGKTLCLVGESGCGKSVTSMAILGLLPRHVAHVSARCIRFEETDLHTLPETRLRSIWGRRIGMVFQEPMTSLTPTMTVGEQIAEVLRLHLKLDRRAARRRSIELLDRVRIPQAQRRVDEYPFAFSGGMRQRVMIAIAIACSPSLLIADEPTTALDVTVQMEILNLLHYLQAETGMALLLITHDLGVVAETADDVAVMYAGRIVEHAPVDELFEIPEHPYTIGLLGAVPGDDAQRGKLTPVEGRVPLPGEFLPGCRFEARCPFSIPRCREEEPPLTWIAGHRHAACWRAHLEGDAA